MVQDQNEKAIQLRLPDVSEIADMVRDFDPWEDTHRPDAKGNANRIAADILALLESRS